MPVYGFGPVDDQERAKLEHLWRRGATPLVRRRAQIVLLAGELRTHAEIAKAARCSRDTVLRTLRRYRTGACEGLMSRPAPRPRPVRTQRWVRELSRAMEMGPEACGVPRPTWTAPLLALHLERQTGTPVNEHTVRRGLAELGYVCRRPTWTVRHKAEAQPNYVRKRKGSWRS